MQLSMVIVEPHGGNVAKKANFLILRFELRARTRPRPCITLKLLFLYERNLPAARVGDRDQFYKHGSWLMRFRSVEVCANYEGVGFL